MDNDLNTGIFCANVVDVLRQKSLVDRTMSLPQNYFRGAQAVRSDPAINEVRIPDHHFVERYAEAVSGIAAEMLVGQKKQFGILCQSPLHGASGIGRCADHASTLSAEGLDRRRRVDVGQGCDALA